MTKILVPIDFSDCSNFALNYAIALAKDTKTALHLLHVVELDFAFSGGDVSGAKLALMDVKGKPVNQLKDVFKKAKSLLKELSNNIPKGIRYKVEVVDGDLIGEMLAYGKKNEIDLVVMGSHGERGANSFLLGSNSQKLIRFSSIPVIVVKDEVKKVKFKNIVYSSDFKEEKLNNSLKYVQNIAKYFKSNIHLLFINTPNKFEESDVSDKRMKKVIKDFKLECSSYSTFNSSWIEEGISKYALIEKPDLIVINTHGFKGIKKLFHYSIAESITNNVSVPVMIINKL